MKSPEEVGLTSKIHHYFTLIKDKHKEEITHKYKDFIQSDLILKEIKYNNVVNQMYITCRNYHDAKTNDMNDVFKAYEHRYLQLYDKWLKDE